MIITDPSSNDTITRSAYRLFIAVHIGLLLCVLLMLALLAASNPEPAGTPQGPVERFDRALPLIWLISIVYSIAVPLAAHRLTIPAILGSATITMSLIIHAIVDPRNASPYLWLLYAVPVFLPAAIVAICQRRSSRAA